MRKEDCYQLGYVSKTHGLKGEVTVELDVDSPEEYEEMESVFLEQSGNLIPFFIQKIGINGSKALISFDEIEDIQSAKSLVGCGLFLPVDLLPDLEEGEYYYHDLIGFEVYSGSELLGKINSIFQPSSQYLASVTYKGEDLLIPIEDAIFYQVDLETKEAKVKLPDGFMEIYFEDEN